MPTQQLPMTVSNPNSQVLSGSGILDDSLGPTRGTCSSSAGPGGGHDEVARLCSCGASKSTRWLTGIDCIVRDWWYVLFSVTV